ncbi:hypothetical protein NAPIS_ORF00969 [Vairimorpha apis BRL 01]|uniref:Uncharacterized protein n=1 Tax=Vairimorpha apis BRL 01 TaxID=1037528 RepID=T0LAZ8_9MICR|nr:hypothetical protein NAPIS_ORF00969 [Vairimorpha apis BRL 01]
MNIIEKILNFLDIKNHTVCNLEYINKTRSLQNKFSVIDIKHFYKNYCNINNDIKMRTNKSYVLCISIAYCLINNENFLKNIDDEFFVLLFENNLELIKISDYTELRLVEIINKTNNFKLLKYIKNFKNKLKFNVNVIKYNYDVSYLMTYNDKNIEIIKEILIKSFNNSYKKNLIEYINAQGCINNVIFYNCVILNKHKIIYINNLDVEEIMKKICNKHILEFLEKSEIYHLRNSKNKFVDVNIEDFCNIKNQNDSKKIVLIQKDGKDDKFVFSDLEQVDFYLSFDHSIREKIQYLKNYEFSFIYSHLNKILDEHKDKSVLHIQDYLIEILQEGFFEETYFDMIQNLYNKLIMYNKNIKCCKNNDKILLLVSKYCKFFDNTIYIGHIKIINTK